jgi:hypothetical protein
MCAETSQGPEARNKEHQRDILWTGHDKSLLLTNFHTYLSVNQILHTRFLEKSYIPHFVNEEAEVW